MRIKLTLLGIVALSLIIGTFFFPRMPQPLSYHDFADKRVFFSIPNTFDVFSNLPLLVFGIWGLILVLKAQLEKTSKEERALWILFFASVSLTALFSAYYHLMPTHLRLAFDRTFLSVAMTSFLSLMLIERVGKIGSLLAPFLIIAGIGSVFYWILSEYQGVGDLRFYGLIQFGSAILIFFAFLLFPSNYPAKPLLYLAFLSALMAKIFENWDQKIFNLLQGSLSGHTLKHLFSSLVVLFLVLYLRARKYKILHPFQIETGKSLNESMEELILHAKKGPLTIKEISEILSGKGRVLILIFLSLPFCQPIQIPGLSLPFGLIIAIIGLRLGLGKRFWLPKFLLNKKISSEKVQKIATKSLHFLQKNKRWIHPRLLAMSKTPVMKMVNGLLLFCLGIFLALPLPIPLTNLVAAWAIFLIAVGMLEDDGLFMLLGYIIAFVVLIFFLVIVFSYKFVLSYLL